MLSKHHFLLSLATGLALLLVTPASLSAWLVVGLAVAAGVLIDLDHFLVARLNQGDWRATVHGLRNPRLLVFDQDKLFDEDALWGPQRLLSHAVIATVVVGVLLAAASSLPGGLWLAIVAAASIWVHLLSDLAWDNYHLERDFRRHARHLGFDA